MENLGVLWYTDIEDSKWALAEKYTFPPRLEEALELIINIQDDILKIHSLGLLDKLLTDKTTAHHMPTPALALDMDGVSKSRRS